MGLLVTIAIRVVEVLFAVGAIGSTIVLILSGIEDVQTLIGSDESNHH